MSSTKKLDRFERHVGKHVNVVDYGLGVLKYFVKEAGICGIELVDAVGDCDGRDAEGTRFFNAKDGHGLFIEMGDVTLCDATGRPLKRPAKAAVKPKKKFDSPPSIRKKINRSSKSTAPRGVDQSSGKRTTNTTSSTRASALTEQRSSSSGSNGQPSSKKSTGGSDRSVNHLAKSKVGVDDSVQHMQEKRTISRKVPKAKSSDEAIVADRTLEVASKRKEAEEADAEDEDGADTHTSSVLDVPEDWVEAAKREKAAQAERIAREQELADLQQQEKRLAEAEERRAAEEALFLEKAAEEAARRDAQKAERKAARDAQAAARAAEREEAHLKAAAEIAEYTKTVEKEKIYQQSKAAELTAKREAQKARVAAMMAKVKKRSN